MTDRQVECPRCHTAVRARSLYWHSRRCWYPRTLERMYEVLGVDTGGAGCWYVTARGVQGVATARPKINGKRVTRWIIAIRDGADIDDPNQLARHTCDDERCVRLDHIVVGTRRDNLLDMIERGQQRYGGERSEKLRAYWARRRAEK